MRLLTQSYPPRTLRVYVDPYPFEFTQRAKYMVMLFEYDHTLRRIYTDGRKLPENPDPTCMEFSVGHWEAFTTFVVETVGFHAWDSQKRTTKSRLLTGTALRDSARRDEESYLS